MANNWRSKSIKRRSTGHKPLRKNGRHIGRWLLLATGLIGIFYMLFFMLPRVEITLIPDTRLVTVKETAQLSESARQVDSASRTVPVTQVKVSGEVSGDFPATGEKDIGERAAGLVTFFNWTGLPFELLVEDGLETIDGVKFTVKTALIIPGATVSAEGEIVPGQISAEIIALEPGEAGNIEPQRIFISSVAPDKQHKIYAENSIPLAGGTSEVIQVVAQEDLDTARAELEQELTRKLRQEIRDNLGPGRLEIVETFSLSNSEFKTEVEIDEELADFTASLSALGTEYVYKRNDLRELIKSLVLPQLTSAEQLVDAGPAELEFKRSDPATQDSTLVLEFKAQWPVSQRIDIDRLKERILGRREADARRLLLQEPAISDVRFDWSAAISRKIPKIPSHVSLIITTN